MDWVDGHWFKWLNQSKCHPVWINFFVEAGNACLTKSDRFVSVDRKIKPSSIVLGKQKREIKWAVL